MPAFKTPLQVLLLAGTCLLALGLAACSGEPKPGGITITLVSLHAAADSPAATSAVMTLRYTNENVVPLGYAKTLHKLYLNGTFVGKVLDRDPIGLPPLSGATRDVAIQFENPGFVRQLIATAEQRTASYQLDSVLSQVANEEHLEIKTSSRGSVDLRGLAPAP